MSEVKKRNPFDDDEKLLVDPVGALCDRMDWLREQQLMLSVGTQGVIHGQQNVERKLDDHKLDADVRIEAVRLAVSSNNAYIAKLAERQVWVIALAAVPCLIVTSLGGLVLWRFVERAMSTAQVAGLWP